MHTNDDIYAVLMEVKLELKTTREEVTNFKNELSKSISKLEEENRELRTQLNILNNKIEKAESNSRRKNVIIQGIEQNEEETYKEREDKIRKFMETELKMDTEQVQEVRIERMSRLYNYKGKTKPILVEFGSVRERNEVLRLGRTEIKDRKEKWVREDNTKYEREQRKILYPFLKMAYEQGSKARIEGDKLIVNSKEYEYDHDNKTIRETGKKKAQKIEK